MNKYTTTPEGSMLRIISLTSFGHVKKGEKGGLISNISNLSQHDNAWVYGNARVLGNAQVYGNARVYGNAQVYGDARVFGNAQVYGDARVYGNARVYGSAWVYGNVQMYGSAWVGGDARVHGSAWVFGDAQVYGNAQVSGDVQVYGNAQMFGDAISIKKAICISNLAYHITISDTHIAVGCQNHTKEQWLTFTKKEINAMAADALAFYPLLKKLINHLA